MMKNLFTPLALISCVLVACSTLSAQVDQIPHLEKRGDISQLIVKGKPFLTLAGELRNSSASSPEYMKDIWPAFRGSGVNTVLAVVSWNQIEPVEGQFDFSQMDAMIRDARENDLKLVILWFGSFKNGGSGYIPGWVGSDPKRFPRAVTQDGLAVPCLSTLYENNWQADQKAFVAMMQRLKEIDQKENTVLFIQVENEMGLFFERDCSPKAESLFNSAVPKELVDYLSAHKGDLLPETLDAWKNSNYATSGTWQEMFGQNVTTSEFFMAWNYSRYIEEISKPGKAMYPIPMFVNVALQHVGDKVPGDYPSGGPVAQVHDIWRVGAPSIDFYSPDIYDADFTGILDRYSRKQTAIFVPESMSSAANAVYLIGERRGFGFSPFGIDGGIKNNKESTFYDAYRMMDSFHELILDHQAKGTIHAAWLTESGQGFVMGNHKVIVSPARGFRMPPPTPANPAQGGANGGEASAAPVAAPGARGGAAGARGGAAAARGGAAGGGGAPGGRGGGGYAMILQMGEDEYLVMASGAQVAFAPADGKGITAFAKVNEGYFTDNVWHPLRWLNGDETNISQDLDTMARQGQSGYGLKFGSSPQLQRVWLYDF